MLCQPVTIFLWLHKVSIQIPSRRRFMSKGLRLGRLGAVDLIVDQVQAWTMQTALDIGPCYEPSSSTAFVRDDGGPQIVANSVTTSFAMNLIRPVSRQQTKRSLPVRNILGEPIFMHPPDTRRLSKTWIRFNSSDGLCPLDQSRRAREISHGIANS